MHWVVALGSGRSRAMVDAILVRHTSVRRPPLRRADVDALRVRWPRIEEIDLQAPLRDSLDQFDETYPWSEATEIQAQAFHDVLEAVDAHPDAQLLYMGFASVPLAVHLGWLFGQTARVEVFQYHPELRSWTWPRAEATPTLMSATTHPRADASSERDILFRVSCSHHVHPSKTRTIASRAHEIDVALTHPSPTALASPADLDTLGRSFRQALDRSAAAFPMARMRHLAAAVPVGGALTLGMQLSSTKHLPIQIWKHLAHRERTYARALCIGEYLRLPGVLLLGAAPIDAEALSAPAEVQALTDLLTEHETRLRVAGRAAAGTRDLSELLADFDPTIVHLASHGRAEDGCLPASLTLSTPQGLALEVELEDLLRSLRRAPNVMCVVLTACESAAMAEQLAVEVPASVGFRGRLFDEPARSFAAGFWSSLASGRSVAEAFRDGRMCLGERHRDQAVLHSRVDIDSTKLTPIPR